MDRFVARENIRHFCDRLETETDPATRSLLHRLLVQEEDKLGRNSEALLEIEKHIARAQGYVNRQHALVVSIERDGHDTVQARVLLKHFSETLLIYENQREKLLIELDRSRL